MSENESELSWFGDKDDQDEPPAVEFEPGEPHPQRWWLRTRWVVTGFAALVVVGLVVGILVFNASAPGKARGARTPGAAAAQFVAALNAGSGDDAAALSCETFADQARAAARSGADPGISYALTSVQQRGKDNAIAVIDQQAKVGGSTQTLPSRLTLRRGSNLWLICGRLG